MKKLVLVLLLCAGAAWGQPSGGIPPRPQRVLFANLGTPQDSNWRYCTDCTATSPCAGSGSGAFAYRVGSAWNCSNGGSGVATPVSAANGGTGLSSATAYAPIFGGTTSTGAFQSGTVGTSGQVLTSNGAGALPTFQAAAAGGLNTAMSNLASVAANASILPGTNGTLSLGNQSFPWLALFLSVSGAVDWRATGGSGVNQLQYIDGTGPAFFDDNAASLNGALLVINMQGLTADRTYTAFNGSGTLVLDTATQTLTNKTLTDAKTSGVTPAVSNTTANSCGTSAATITGNNTTGVVTVGATAGTNCTITFTVAAPSRRQCTVTNETTANLSRSTYLTTTTSTFEGTFAAGDKISYVCAVY